MTEQSMTALLSVRVVAPRGADSDALHPLPRTRRAVFEQAKLVSLFVLSSSIAGLLGHLTLIASSSRKPPATWQAPELSHPSANRPTSDHQGPPTAAVADGTNWHRLSALILRK
ncbi:MAG TPA: hypothetical protein VGP93_19440 [Polyangiaceae bacterium]|nr:hypothetical protein [Polyangiaceae bacterium]